MHNHLLTIQDLSIGFKKNIFNNINAHIAPGTITALMGVNGAGKSCLLKTIGRLIPPLAGHLKLNHIDFDQYAPLEFSKMVALVLTEKIQVDFLRVDELIALGRSPYTNWLGSLQASDSEIVDRIMEQVGIAHLANAFFAELSDGQKQKVLIARALAQNPQLLILDEPTTYLDIPSKIDLLKLLQKITRENNVAILMSTHDLDLVKTYADQVWLMGKQEKLAVGTPKNMELLGLFFEYFGL